MKNYMLLIMAMLPIVSIWAGGELQQGVTWQELEKKEIAKEEAGYGDWGMRIFKDGSKLYNQLDMEGYSTGYIYEDIFGNTTYYNPSKQIIKYEKTTRTPKTAPSLQEQITQKMGRQAIEAALKKDADDCDNLQKFIEGSGELSPTVKKEAKKYITLCDLLNALNNQQFQKAEKIINTQVGRDEQSILDPNTQVAGQSLLKIILKKAVNTTDSVSFQELLHLAQMLINKKPDIGTEENILLKFTTPSIKEAGKQPLIKYLKILQ